MLLHRRSSSVNQPSHRIISFSANGKLTSQVGGISRTELRTALSSGRPGFSKCLEVGQNVCHKVIFVMTQNMIFFFNAELTFKISNFQKMMTMTMTMTLREVPHLSVKAWPYKRECRGHNPAKKRICCTDAACSVGKVCTYTLLTTLCNTSDMRET